MPYQVPWGTVIKTLLKKIPTDATSLGVTENGSNLDISSTNRKTLQALQALLSSPTLLRNAMEDTLNFLDPRLGEAPETFADKATEWPDRFKQPGFMSGENILNGLSKTLSLLCVGQFWKIDPTTFARQGLSVTKQDIAEQGILQITFPEPASTDRLPNIRLHDRYTALMESYKTQIAFYLSSLAGFTKKELLECFTETRSDTSPAMAEAPAYLSEEILQSILYIVKHEGNFQICFHYRDFVNYLFPSVTASDIQENNTTGVSIFSTTINKHDLVILLCACFRNNFIMDVDPSGKTVTPLCFAPLETQPKDLHITILVDCSDSMSSVFRAFQKRLIELCGKLQQISSNATVRIHPFASNRTNPLAAPQTFSINKKEEIKSYILQLTADGETPLWDTLLTEYNEIIKRNRQFCEPVILLFTDGAHTQSDEEEQRMAGEKKYEEVLNLAQQWKRQRQPVKFYTVGLGDEHDQETLTMLARETAASYYSLDDMEQFPRIYEDITDMTAARALVRIGSVGGDLLPPISVPVDTVVSGPSLPADRPIMFNGSVYTLNTLRTPIGGVLSSIFSTHSAAAAAPATARPAAAAAADDDCDDPIDRLTLD